MKAHKMNVTIPEDHQVEILLPEDFPSGPAEIIVLAEPSESEDLGGAQEDMLRVLERLRTVQRTPEEERILDEFEEFRRQQSIHYLKLKKTHKALRA